MTKCNLSCKTYIPSRTYEDLKDLSNPFITHENKEQINFRRKSVCKNIKKKADTTIILLFLLFLFLTLCVKIT
jgi:hypothetical protein